VFAVPGPIESPASTGTNRLLCDGAAPVTETADVLAALGLDRRRAGRSRFDARRRPTDADAALIAMCREQPRLLEQLAAASPAGLVDVALAVARLEQSGWLRETGGWFEAVDDWADLA
jgi:DNA processing protein